MISSSTWTSAQNDDHDANDDHGDWSPWPEPPWQLLLQQPSLFGVELAGAHLLPFGDVYKCENTEKGRMAQKELTISMTI